MTDTYDNGASVSQASTASPAEIGDGAAFGEPSQGTARRHPPKASWLDMVVHRFAVIGIWALMFVIFVAIEPSKMLQVATFQSIFGSQQPLIFLGMAALCTFVVGEFDLSIASVMGLCGTVVAVLVVLHGVNVFVACVIALAVGALCGLVNGFVVVVVGVNGLIVTLGAATLLLGIAFQISDNQAVSGLSISVSKVALEPVLGLPISFYYGIAAVFVFAYVISFTPLGRHMTFVGANREVARLAGVRVDRIRFCSYVASALIASVGGILLAASLGGFDSSDSANYLLPALSAVFLGTAVIQPGRSNPIGTAIGVYFLATGIMGLELLGLGGWIQDVFYGAALVIAVAVSGIVRRRRESG
jgi:ribose transport system permease protein